MTMYEALDFIAALHAHVARSVEHHGPWTWPTRELVNYNLRINRAAFPRDAKVGDSFKRQLGIALRRGWVTDGPCQSHCHAHHLTITADGAKALAWLHEQLCGCDKGPIHAAGFRLERKVA